MPQDSRCRKCALHGSSKNVCIWGRGSTRAKVMLVGEAPGEAEARFGKPFMGRSGKLLGRVLSEIGVDESDVYITNVVKCRPPDNRTPLPEEIEACVDYFEEEVDDVQPEVIVPLGASAMEAILGLKGITKLRGTINDYPGDPEIKVIPTFHPANILRNPKNLGDLVNDLTTAFGIDDTEAPEIKYKLVETLDDLDEAIAEIESSEDQAFSFDTETNSLYWESPDFRIAVLGLSTLTSTWVVPIHHPAGPFLGSGLKAVGSRLKRIFINKRLEKHGWNLKYDEKCLYAAFGFRVAGPRFDGMLAHYLVDENLPHGLGYVVGSRWPQYAGFKSKLDSELKSGQALSIPLPDVAERVAEDAWFTRRLSEWLIERLEDEGQTDLFYKLMMPASNLMVDLEIEGNHISLEKLRASRDVYRAKIEEDQEHVDTDPSVQRFLTTRIREEMRDYLDTRKRATAAQIRKRRVKLGEKFGSLNVNSYKEMARFLYHPTGMDLTPPTMKKGKKKGDGPPTNREALEVLMSSRQVDAENRVTLGKIVSLRKDIHLVSTYMDGIEEAVLRSKDLRVHPTVKLHGTVTGRLSMENPTLHNIPRDTTASDIKRFFTAPPGYKVVESDYSQAELRVLAAMSGDKELIRAFNEGFDIHLYSAAKAAHVTYEYANEKITNGTPEEKLEWKMRRKRAKAINFGIAYCESADGLAETLSHPDPGSSQVHIVSVEEAQSFLDDWFRGFPRVKSFIEGQKAKAHRSGVVLSMFGRKRRLYDINSDDRKLVAEAERQSVNAVIQSTASDFTLYSSILIRKELLRRGEGIQAKQVGTVHDSLIFYCKAEHVDAFCKLVKEVSTDSSKPCTAFGFEFAIPLEVDLKVGDNWAELEEWKE